MAYIVIDSEDVEVYLSLKERMEFDLIMASLEKALDEDGFTDDEYVVFSSCDPGYAAAKSLKAEVEYIKMKEGMA